MADPDILTGVASGTRTITAGQTYAFLLERGHEIVLNVESLAGPGGVAPGGVGYYLNVQRMNHSQLPAVPRDIPSSTEAAWHRQASLETQLTADLDFRLLVEVWPDEASAAVDQGFTWIVGPSARWARAMGGEKLAPPMNCG